MASETRAAIEALLPHRPPFLFVDRILETGPSQIVCEWDVAPDLACFAGHYPGQPVLPGVLIAEFALQSGAILVHRAEEQQTSHVPVVARIEDARFKKIVEPGETLRAVVTLKERLANACFLAAKVTSADETVARLRFVLASAPRPGGAR